MAKSKLHDKLEGEIPGIRNEVHALAKERGAEVVSQVTVAQVLGGMRGVKGLLCDTSVVDPDKGLIVRGIPIGKLSDRIPEEIFHLLLTGELPTDDELADLQDELRKRSEVPAYVWDVLKAMPEDSHPMAMFSTAILVMERESIFRRRYAEGMHKDEYWEPALEDSLNLIAKLPSIAAGIYRLHTKKGEPIPSDQIGRASL